MDILGTDINPQHIKYLDNIKVRIIREILAINVSEILVLNTGRTIMVGTDALSNVQIEESFVTPKLFFNKREK